jgi:hypothetical protein
MYTKSWKTDKTENKIHILISAPKICMFVGMDPRKDPAIQHLFSVTDDDLEEQKPYTRAIISHRLNQVWEACLPHVDGTDFNPDYRYVDLAVRVLDRMAKVARIHDKPPATEPVLEADPVADRAAVLEAVRRELERGTS